MLTIRKEPNNLNSEDLWLFKNELRKEFSDPLIVDLKEVIITADINFTQNLKSNVLVSYNANFFQPTFLQLIKRFVKQNLPIKLKKHFIITDSWSNGYFHWLLDCLPRLMLLEESGLNLPLILPSFLKDKDYVSESLSLLGKTNYQFLKKNKWYFFKSLSFPVHLATTGNYNDQIIKKIRNRIKSDRRQIPGLKIYISRSKALMRKITNEDEIIPLLSKMGFKIIFCEDMTFAEQVHLFSKVKYLVSNHGAGLSNMLFMSPQTSVLELRKKNDDHNNCYFSLASALDLKYYYLECIPVKDDEETHTANLLVDPNKFSQCVLEMINHK